MAIMDGLAEITVGLGAWELERGPAKSYRPRFPPFFGQPRFLSIDLSIAPPRQLICHAGLHQDERHRGSAAGRVVRGHDRSLFFFHRSSPTATRLYWALQYRFGRRLDEHANSRESKRSAQPPVGGLISASF